MSTTTTQELPSDYPTLLAWRDSLKETLANSKDLPIADLTAQVLLLTTKATLYPALKGDLLLAANRRDEAVRSNAHRNVIRQQLELADERLRIMAEQERIARIEQANERLQQARQDYLSTGAALIRSYRRVLTIARANQSIPGASTSLPKGFDFQAVNVAFQNSSTSEAMEQGKLAIENRWALEEQQP